MSILNKVWTTHNENHTTLSLRSNSTDPMKYGYIHVSNKIFPDRQVVIIPFGNKSLFVIRGTMTNGRIVSGYDTIF